MLLQALAQEGVDVDPVTLFASLAAPIGRGNIDEYIYIYIS
jgi:hypothetical protein